MRRTKRNSAVVCREDAPSCQLDKRRDEPLFHAEGRKLTQLLEESRALVDHLSDDGERMLWLLADEFSEARAAEVKRVRFFVRTGVGGIPCIDAEPFPAEGLALARKRWNERSPGLDATPENDSTPPDDEQSVRERAALIDDESSGPGSHGSVRGYCVRDISWQSFVPSLHWGFQQHHFSRAADEKMIVAMSVPSGQGVCSALALDSNRLPHMPASTSTVDRRPIPTVAIIGNDAVLVAAPATPVQLSHACLRRGFTVAVPASWGDELVAAETLRQLTSRERGPAVMCVCPYARSRLLASGSDLEPFLVSLVSPPVATARYLRGMYGERGVHITYIGACPSADDPAIDAHLTPDTFLADLAEHGIALSEQPLVFDSIVPPDRRRWCSLPGGAPSIDVLGIDAETRTLVEIEPDDISTDLAQHIIAHEHVLLDLAPSLGCACSGAIGASPPRMARLAIVALEPPRALGPVIDPGVAVSLVSPPSSQPVSASAPVALSQDILLEMRLDEMLGTELTDRPIADDGIDEFEAELDADLAESLAASRPVDESHNAATAVTEPAPLPRSADSEERHDDVPAIAASAVELSVGVIIDVVERERDDRDAPPVVDSTPSSAVRRRTPQALPARYPAGTIPKATGSNGRTLPRAYVAKRRTPSMGVPSIESPASSVPVNDDVPAILARSIESHPQSVTADAANVGTRAISASQARDADDLGASTLESAAAPRVPAAEPSMNPSTPLRSVIANSTPVRDAHGAPESTGAGSGLAAPVSSHGALSILLYAVLLGVAIIVLVTLRP